ncbi:MAG: arsenate reductase [Alphaproteobacteria bacterium]
MITVYGIRNCDTCRKALKWLEAENIEHRFHDFRKDGLADTQVADWLEAVGPDVLLNKRGTTWRNLDDAQKADAEREPDKLAALLLEHPTLIKRPVSENGDRIYIGFTEKVQKALAS